MGCLFCVFFFLFVFLSGLLWGNDKGSPREWKDFESGHVMNYNQRVSQCTFIES